MKTSQSLPLSVIVIAYNMAREIPRTVLSLSSQLQRDIDEGDYEIIVIDNGSSDGFDYPGLAALGGNIVVHTVGDASPSPVTAINHGLALARGELVGVFIDGARIASPRLLATAREAAAGQDHPLVGTLAFHLGPDVQYRSIERGYDRATEDRLLAYIDWPHVPYRLYEIAVFAGSSAGGWFALPAESNALFMRRKDWQALGGYEPRFVTPGGGLVNLDTWYRACTAPGAKPILLLGEATFHQVHGGVATNATDKWPLFHAEYRAIRGRDYRKPDVRPLFFGRFPAEAQRSLTTPADALPSQPATSSAACRPTAAGERALVIVAGGHRTGTSATAGLLAQLGLNAGDNLQAGDAHNARGYFEDRAVVALHDRLLGQLQSSWDSRRPLPEGWTYSPHAVTAGEAICDFVTGLAAGKERIGIIKDPRSCLLLPLWLAACKKTATTPLFVIPIRSPDASITSLVRRNGFSVEHAALLWLTHLRNAERHSRGCRRDFVHYEAMLADWQREIARLDASLDLALDWDEERIRQGSAFLSSELNHAPKATAGFNSPALKLARELYRQLLTRVPAHDPTDIFDRIAPTIDRMVFSELAAPPVAPTTDRPTPSIIATTSSISVKPVDPRRFADRQEHLAALGLIDAGDLIGGADRLIALAQADTPLADVYVDLGRLAVGQGDLAAAQELFATAVGKSSTASPGQFELARLAADAGEADGALTLLSPYLRTHGDDAEALALARRIVGCSGELPAVAWARLVADLRAAPGDATRPAPFPNEHY